jgi:hypothetical protein
MTMEVIKKWEMLFVNGNITMNMRWDWGDKELCYENEWKTEWNQVFFALPILWISMNWTFLLTTRHSTYWKYQREQKQNNMKILSRVMMYSSYAQLSWCWPQKVVKSSNNNQISAYLDISKMPFVLSVIHFINVYGCK